MDTPSPHPLLQLHGLGSSKQNATAGTGEEIRWWYPGGEHRGRLFKSRQAQCLRGQGNFSSVKYWSSFPASEACPGFLSCQGHIAQLPVGVPQPWKEAQAVGLPGPAALLLKDRGECHSWVNAPSNDLSEISLVCFSVCPPQCICSDSKKTRPLIAHQVP